MNAEIKTVTITKDTYDDLIALSKHALNKIVVEKYDIEYLLRCMAVVGMLEVDFCNCEAAVIGKDNFDLLMGIISEETEDGAADE